MKEAIITNKSCYRFVLLVIFILSFFAVRIPLLHEDLGFEEGIFADLIVNRPEGPMYALGGRINGENIYGIIWHPATPYELLRLGGFLFHKCLTHDIYLDDSKITPRLRLISSSYQFIFFLILLLFTLFDDSHNRTWSVLILFSAMLSPLAIKTSAHLQIDNTSGVLLCGISAFLFVTTSKMNLSSAKKGLLLFSGGFIAGLGKQEWSLMLLAALICMFLLVKIIKFDFHEADNIISLCCVVAGLILGNIACYLYDPTNYAGGLHILSMFLNPTKDTVHGWSFEHWVWLMKSRLPFISICLTLLLPVSYVLIFRNRSCLFCLTSLFGLFLFLGYVLSNWTEKPRYFCPSMSVLIVTAIRIIPQSLPRWLRKSFLIMLTFIFVSTLIFLFKFTPDKNKHLEAINQGILKSSSDSVLYIQSGAGWNKPAIDYVNNNSPYDKVQNKVAEEYGKKLIKPDI
jgi:hypothetical protein